jgi:2-amino-4-hydroxy-6-hydroxymethyldihydropteridine diphosphokinase
VIPALIGLGASLGPRLQTLRLAAELIESWPGVRSVARSRVFLSAPMGPAARPFLNAAIRIDTSLEPRLLLGVCKEVECRLGRRAATRWADRMIDLDLLLVGEIEMNEPDLTLPHPGLLSRSFVLVPGQEVGGDLIHPGQTEPLSKCSIPQPTGLRLWSCLGQGALREQTR